MIRSESSLGKKLEIIIFAVEMSLRTFLALDPALTGRKPHHTGGVLVVMDKATGVILFMCSIGIPQPSRQRGYVEFALEKAYRLYCKHMMEGHTSSAQSASIPNQRYPGAIVAGDLIISLSGFSYWPEESVALHASHNLNLIPLNEAKETANYENHIFEMLLEASPKL